jgi:hypothetical protein
MPENFVAGPLPSLSKPEAKYVKMMAIQKQL